ncbi:MAG: galactose-1-phosphate uridylyltransferase [Nitrospinae bacterium]|nr:galactose-1-phosphate uridylyltransferase [Nitrospinota bacterium]
MGEDKSGTGGENRIRLDRVTCRQVVVAEERRLRPMPRLRVPEVDDQEPCPFCEGREEMTPPETFAHRAPGSRPNAPGWRLRVVPNKFPAFAGEMERRPAGDSPGWAESSSSPGISEVIIETPDHKGVFSLMTEGEMDGFFRAIRSRIAAFGRAASVAWPVFFKNHGAMAGASLSHPHSQVMGVPVTPGNMEDQLSAASAHFSHTGQCAFCAEASGVAAQGGRLVAEEGGFAHVAPYVSRFAYETWILPKKHMSAFEDMADEDTLSLARLVKKAAGKLDGVFGRPPFNMILITAPYRHALREHFHWRLEIFPVLGRMAGFEWGAGMNINTVSPETAARVLAEGAPLK